ncbi:transcriptional regulator [Nocardia nepalensis]|uniref:transcriptional regulator n=1 Tax=Nocardia nepalensis TaxID=3375448 RepID=UPI003B679ED4
MPVQLLWTGLEVRALRDALRETRTGFCELTGVRFDALRKWERRGPTLTLRAVNAAIMDTTLARTTVDQRTRFELRCAELRREHNLSEASNPTPKLIGECPKRSPAPHKSQYLMEINDMNRRSLLSMLGVGSAVLATPVDWGRIVAATRTGSVDATAAEHYTVINRALWQDYSAVETKAEMFAAVRGHLDKLIDGVRHARNNDVRTHLYELSSEALQLLGEILFDSDDYHAAASCYTLAASFGKEAAAHDLWACALTRHAYLGIYNHQYAAAIPLLESASYLAQQGDSQLATRYWVDAVHAQALAGLGDAAGWARAAESAQGVQELGRETLTGWLRFDGTRLDEERGHCLVQLGQHERAETTLVTLLDRPLSTRRRAGVLIDLAASSALRRDPVQLVAFGNAALDTAHRTHSGYLGRRLDDLREHLHPLLADVHVRNLDEQIAYLLSPTTTPRRDVAQRH